MMQQQWPIPCLPAVRDFVAQAQAQVQHEVDENTSAKKPRVVWSVEMHQQFVNAVNSLGIDSEHIFSSIKSSSLTTSSAAPRIEL